MTAEKLCLKWNDFEANISRGILELKDDKDFCDVTLACEDDQISAHKVILSACSPFFCTVLRRNSHPHPLLYMKGVRFTDLESVLDFMYHGEVSIAQDDLNNFLAVAEDLCVKGLTQNNGESKPSSNNFSSVKPNISKRNVQKSVISNTSRVPGHENDEDIQEVVPIKTESSLGHLQQYEGDLGPYDEEDGYGYYEDTSFLEGREVKEQIVVNNGQSGFTSPADFDQYIRNMGGGLYACTLCTHTQSQKNHVKNHVESIHFPNTFSYNCPHCDKVFGTYKAYLVHKNRAHKGE